MDKTSDKFQAGQVWKYDTRPGEDSSTLTILKVEKYENGELTCDRDERVKINLKSGK